MRCMEDTGRPAQAPGPDVTSRMETWVAWVVAVLVFLVLGLAMIHAERAQAQEAKPAGDPLARARLLDEFRTQGGAQVKVYELADRSVVFSGEEPVRTTAGGGTGTSPAGNPAASPAETYRQLAGGRKASAALREVLTRPMPPLKAAPRRPGMDGVVRPLKTMGGGVTPEDDGQQWFRNQYCANTSGAAYNWCLTGFSGNGWAFSNNVWYGRGTACAITGAPTLTVRYVGSWTVPAGTCHWAIHSVSGGLFNPDPRFDFRMDITGNGGTYDFSGWTLR